MKRLARGQFGLANEILICTITSRSLNPHRCVNRHAGDGFPGSCSRRGCHQRNRSAGDVSPRRFEVAILGG